MMKKVIERAPASFRDPSGFLYQAEGTLFRQINLSYQAEYDLLVRSGLYRTLETAGLLLQHEQVDVEPADPAKAYRVIQPEALPFISYPYEWCFSQLKDAALATLKIQRTAIDHGMSLKDASAYNFQFHAGRVLLIDTLSFENLREGEPWVAYRQFCQHFLAPLALMAYTDVRLGQLLRLHIDGVPLDLACSLLPGRAWLNMPLYIHLRLHAASQRRHAGRSLGELQAGRRMGRMALLGLIDSLENGIRRLRWEPGGTAWADYERLDHYSDRASQAKKEMVAEFLHRLQPRTVWDLGANVGVYSRVASEASDLTISIDSDPAAVEKNYLEVTERGLTNLLPLIADLTNPSPGLGWESRERASLVDRGPADAVLALAVIHHLAISNNVPLQLLARFFAHITRWLIIEFVPKEDSQVQTLLASRQDIFNEYTESHFKRYFEEEFRILEANMIEDTVRTLYLMEKRFPGS